uniref:Uncharacterized protein n=1 Tax=Glossina palpalis gambiensis TaxID=67801 RepID=A0A1B0BTF3_9MUSC
MINVILVCCLYGVEERLPDDQPLHGIYDKCKKKLMSTLTWYSIYKVWDFPTNFDSNDQRQRSRKYSQHKKNNSSFKNAIIYVVRTDTITIKLQKEANNDDYTAALNFRLVTTSLDSHAIALVNQCNALGGELTTLSILRWCEFKEYHKLNIRTRKHTTNNVTHLSISIPYMLLLQEEEEEVLL